MMPDYTAQQPRRRPSSYSPLWELEISLKPHVTPSYLLCSIIELQGGSIYKFCICIPESCCTLSDCLAHDSLQQLVRCHY
jgi:hypothetical protein